MLMPMFAQWFAANYNKYFQRVVLVGDHTNYVYTII